MFYKKSKKIRALSFAGIAMLCLALFALQERSNLMAISNTGTANPPQELNLNDEGINNIVGVTEDSIFYYTMEMGKIEFLIFQEFF